MEIDPMDNDLDYPIEANKIIKKQNGSNNLSDCNCRFKDNDSNTILLCEECSKLPCHNKGKE